MGVLSGVELSQRAPRLRGDEPVMPTGRGTTMGTPRLQLRGEEGRQEAPTPMVPGTPPPARGGATGKCSAKECPGEHPRLRGEEDYHDLALDHLGGTPPPARGGDPCSACSVV
jgi:hypothetical protein